MPKDSNVGDWYGVPGTQDDDHLVTVLRYVERNALRAELVSWAEDWKCQAYRAGWPAIL